MSPTTVNPDLPLARSRMSTVVNKTAETHSTREEISILGNTHPSLPVKTPPVSPKSKQNILSELSLVQSLASRLRRDRNHWRSQALEQKQDLDDTYRSLEDYLRLVSEIEEGNAQLKAQYDEAVSDQAQLTSELEALKIEHKKTVQDLNEAKHRNTILKKDKRTRETVHARNLRLKALIQRYFQQSSTSPTATRTSPKTVSDLQNALKSAVKRVEDLESKGKDLLVALNKRDDYFESNDEDTNTTTTTAKSKLQERMSETQISLRDALSNAWFRKLKSGWHDLLRD